MPLVFSPESQCHGKRRFATKADARRSNTMTVAHGGDRLKAYRCVHCDGWHLGHHVKFYGTPSTPTTPEGAS